MDDMWLAVPDYEDYLVSANGKIISLKAKHYKKQMAVMKSNGGYLRLRLCKNGIKEGFFVHELVVAAFIGWCPEHLDINHKDGNKLNNHISNLETCTRSENLKHAYSIGLRQRKPTSNKFQRDDIIAIRTLFSSGSSREQLLTKYPMSRCNLNKILNRTLWKTV